MRRVTILGLSVMLAFGSLLSGWECGQAPPTQSPQRRKAGEAFPPLPLPATPLRRSEKKNPPSPPILVGKVICGSDESWTRAENDVDNLLKVASSQLSFAYRATRVNLNSFSFDPEEIPILYITAMEAYSPDEKILPRLRGYLEQGGFIWANASSGSPAFTEATVRWLTRLFPERNLYPLYVNHPLKTCFHTLDRVKIMAEGKESDEVLNLRILNLGCRAAVIISPWDLGCGWAMHTHPFGTRYIPSEAINIGMNMLVYSLAWIESGKFFGQMPLYAEPVNKKSGKIYLGQVIHSGDWDPHPSSLGKILRQLGEQTGASVYLEKITVDLKKDNLKDIPLLYLTGHFNPRFTPEEVKKLKNFLHQGGTLLADSCCGSQEFTDAFTSLVKEILPQGKKVTWTADSSVYKFPIKIDRFLYQEPVEKPPLEAYFLSGWPAIVFSPSGLGGGWEGIARPFTPTLVPSQARELGINLLTYLMNH
ncbi:MAG: DUF4159 domain-containing protein [Candidatus Omnitrophica bacterium]|nr:DUF4159 domain-containing protein [Candidatus Omnitrophota bacterium]